MPLYEYQCDVCGHRFEVIQKSSSAPDPVCPKCNGVVHKLQSAPAFQFKGTGWYVTDYGKKDAGGSSGKSGGDSKDESKSSTEKSEKPADGGKSTSSSESSSTSSTTPPASTTPAKNS